jgi:carbamoyl-phosphate synthase large subunit
MRTILVSGASGIVGYGVLRSLRKSGLELKLIGTTIYNDSVAEGFCDVFEQAPLTKDPGYIDWLLGVIKKHRIDFIIPGIEADMYKWIEHVPELEGSGTNVLLNNISLITLCKDKWAFYNSLKKLGSTIHIDTSLNSNYNYLVNTFGLPFLLKPRYGFGSKGIVRIEKAETFIKYQSDIGAVLMAQPIVGNDNEEYTTSAFCDGTGGYYAIMTLRRKLSIEGFTEKAVVVSIDEINATVSILCRYFNPIGPTNFQFRKYGNKLKLLEINPRISSSTSIRSAFGYNESQMAIEYYLENRKPKQPVVKQGRAVRYIEDFIFYENRSNF